MSFKSKDRKSLCEESMLVLVNILKLSSLSLARRTFFTTPEDNPVSSSKIKKTSSAPSTERDSSEPASAPRQTRSKRSQKPEQESQLAYVMVPGDDEEDVPSYLVHEVNDSTSDGIFSDYIKRFHEKTHNDLQNATVEGQAAEYIKRFHEKNRNDSRNESRRFIYVLPPPPREVK